MLITKQLLKDELTQLREQGVGVASLEPAVAAARAEDQDSLQSLYRQLQELPGDGVLDAAEPSTLDEILPLRPQGPRRIASAWSADRLLDRILGAWLGRAAGCLLGKPCEGWHHTEIRAYLDPAGAYPLDDYFPQVLPEPEGAPSAAGKPASWLRGGVVAGPRDDDTDYTILGLYLLEKHGPSFTTEDVAAAWLSCLPYWQVYTAERVAYANLVNGLHAPDTATHHNPYREWIGAQIRADMWGYVCPGRPEQAAELAYRDARLSHVRNGIYGEMWAAACIAAAFAEREPRTVIEAGLSEIPHDCRLAQALRRTMDWCASDPDWETTWQRVARDYGHYHGVHTINNACAVALALLHSGGDFERAVTIAVMCGWDTDCNGATVGSIVGAALGARALPAKWVTPLNDTLHSAVQGFEVNRISDLARRTLVQAQRQMKDA
ncbi:MAG: ADP-ribosylglycohydrolase family protein [Anaerolineae bacterium]|nr:ADP-ribosylglycohydrolase family protein [Anaerolineae bacterium]